MLPFPVCCRQIAVCILLGALVLQPVRAVILLGTADPAANTTAPSGIYADSGWQFLGEYGGSLGTMIAPRYFITARHTGLQGGGILSSAELNGVSDVTYTIDTAANGGVGYWDIAGTDLRILKINEAFPGYVSLYTGVTPVGAPAIVFGRGGQRGAEVELSGTAKGWLHTAADGVVRWGTNTVAGAVSTASGQMLSLAFDAAGGANEATLSSGDSGGGLFVLDDGQWKLAGINFGVDGLFDLNNVVDSNEFGAALFDMGGLYLGSDSQGWNLVPDGGVDVPSHFYASNISASAAVIHSIVGVPEPGSLPLLLIAAALSLLRHHRNSLF